MPLQLDPALDLGRDTERMKLEDKQRQEATANCLLRAFTGPMAERREVQLLADEVGLGKTFVALATAYSLLKRLRNDPEAARRTDLAKCYRAVLVIVPSQTLASKWVREVEAFRERCSCDKGQTAWFRAARCSDGYDLAEKLRAATDLRRNAPCVLVCPANVLSRRVADLGERLRFLAACLFRWWGNRLTIHERYRIVTRAAEVRGFTEWAKYARRVGTSEYEVGLWNFDEESGFVPFLYSDIAAALSSLDGTEDGHARLDEQSVTIREGHEEPKGLLPYCKDAAKRRGHADWYFQGFKDRLLDLYKELAHHLIRQDVPLVVVDEAHHWRNPDRQDCQSFRKRLAPISKRLLLLTATPFQLHRDELLKVLSVGDAMAPAIGSERVFRLQGHCDTIREATDSSEKAGVEFSREWGSLPEQFARVDPRFDPAHGIVPGTADPRTEELARLWAQLPKTDGNAAPLAEVPGDLRRFFKSAFDLRACNRRLGEALRSLVIRHRRPVGHRRVLVGREYPAAAGGIDRPDQHLLHLAPGASIPPHAELAQYPLMKVVAEASQGKHRTALGVDLTGCYTTLWESRDGKRARDELSNPGLLKVLERLTGYRGSQPNSRDEHHPKLAAVVAESLRRWDHGEKTLIFCFRVPTAKTLTHHLERGIQKRLQSARRALLQSRGTDITSEADTDRAMLQFRGSLTARDGSGVPLFLDRVLLGWFQDCGLPLPTLTDSDRKRVASLYARGGTGGHPLVRGGDRLRLDRVFLNRAIEQVWATRLLNDRASWWSGSTTAEREGTRRLLEQVAKEEWVRFRYGQPELSRRKGDADSDAAPTDSVARSSLSGWYDLDATSAGEAVSAVEEALSTTVTGNRASLTDSLVSGPNLFAPIGSGVDFLGTEGRKRAGRMRDLLFQMTFSKDTGGWDKRAKVLDAVVRALLREDILLRLPKNVFKDGDETWAASILRGLHESPGGGQHEPLAGRVEEFLRELAEMGPEERDAHLLYAMNPRAEAVKLVSGETGDRDAVFNGFNTPLLPDILVCTQVGQEGIDLHRHCRHVVHYDLGWNPATIEQRTGRTDRLGSKAMRERNLAIQKRDTNLPGLDIALPYLAGTYDERMYDRLRSRAQTFEILTGGDPSADRDGDTSWLDPDDLGSAVGSDYVQLPDEMLKQLRVNLAVEKTDYKKSD